MWIGVVHRRPVHHLAQECAAPIKRIDRGLSLSECSVPPDSYKTPGSISGWQHRDNKVEGKKISRWQEKLTSLPCPPEAAECPPFCAPHSSTLNTVMSLDTAVGCHCFDLCQLRFWEQFTRSSLVQADLDSSLSIASGQCPLCTVCTIHDAQPGLCLVGDICYVIPTV